MQLYNTKVVPSALDPLWLVPDKLPELSGTRLLVISTPFNPAGNEAQILEKMMLACKLSPQEYSVLQLTNNELIGWASLVAHGIPDKVLLLGINPSQLAISALLRVNFPNQYMGYTIIPSLPLAQIAQDPELKKELWLQGLKPGFGL